MKKAPLLLTFIASSLLAARTASAMAAAGHLANMESMFGECANTAEYKVFLDFASTLSSGMDHVAPDSFYQRLRALLGIPLGLGGGNHRGVGHWDPYGAVPKEFLDQYPREQHKEIVKLWRKVVGEWEQKAAALLKAKGLPCEKGAVRLFIELFWANHVLCDNTTANVKSLVTPKEVLESLIREFDKVFGKGNPISQDLRALLKQLPPNPREAVETILDYFAQPPCIGERVIEHLKACFVKTGTATGKRNADSTSGEDAKPSQAASQPRGKKSPTVARAFSVTGRIAGGALAIGTPVVFAASRCNDATRRQTNGTVDSAAAETERAGIYGKAGLELAAGITLLFCTPAGWTGLGVTAGGMAVCCLTDERLFQILYVKHIQPERQKQAFDSLKRFSGEHAAFLSGFTIPPDLIPDPQSRAAYIHEWEKAKRPPIALPQNLLDRAFEQHDTRAWINNLPD